MFQRMILIIISAVMVCGWVHAELGGIVFKEDFSKYEVGDPISDWGTTDIIVIKTSDDKNWMQSQTPGQHRAEKRLKLPENFVMTFDIISENENFHLVLIDSTEETHEINFIDAHNKVKIKFPDTIEKVVRYISETTGQVKIIKKNKTYKLFLNDSFVLASTPQAFGNVSGFAFKIEPTTKIGNIEIKELILN